MEDFLVEFNKQAQAVANKSSTSVLPLSPSKPALEEDEEEGKMSYVVTGNKTTLLGSWDEENIAQLLATAEKHRRGVHGSDRSEAATESDEDAAKQPGDKDEEDDDDSPCWHWQNLPESQAYSLYLLRWETALQLELGHSISSMIRSMGASAVQDVLSVTVFTTLAVAAFWPVLLLQLTSIIDNLWTIAVERADLAGKELARALLNREHGSRPVTLVGYSMGARVIFSCLRELAHQLHQDINFYEEEVESGPRSVDAAAAGEDSECAVEPNASVDDNDELSGLNESSAVPPTSKEEASTPRSYTSSISNAGSSLFRMVRNTTSSIASTTSNVVSSAASTASSAFTSSSSDTSRQAADGKVKGATDSSNPQKNALRGLIEHVVLLGAPVSHKSRVWGAARELVSGRIINGYSTRDMVLAVVYRYQRFQMAVSGVSPVEGEGVQGIENIDLSDIVEKVSFVV